MGKTLVKIVLAVFIVCVGWNNHAEGELSYPVVDYSVFLRPVASLPDGLAILGDDVSDFEFWCCHMQHKDKKILGQLNRDEWEIRKISDLQDYGAEKRVYCKK